MDKRKRKSVIIEGEVVGGDTETGNHTIREQDAAISKTISRNLSMVSKSNDLIQKTRYSLPKIQQKLLLAMISKIDPKNDTDNEKIYTMTFGEFSKLTGTDLQNSGYKQYMIDVLTDLASSVFWMDIKDVQNDKNKLFRWIGEEAEIDNNKKEIHIQFSKGIFPYLTQLKSNYTSFNVEFLLHMSSTYSMRFYEILKSYDNGDMNYGYTNNIVFQPVTEDMLEKFSDKAKIIRGYKYKVFDINDLKQQLSPAPGSTDDSKGKPLAGKYANFNDFERYVLKKVRSEINLLTDLWFTYIPVRIAGQGRTYRRIYLFIKYKTDKEMEAVYKLIKERQIDEEIPRRDKAEKEQAAEIEKMMDLGTYEEEEDASIVPFKKEVHSETPTKVLRQLEKKSEYAIIQKLINDDSLVSAISGVFTYTSRLLTNTKNEKKAQMAYDTRDALNRIIERDKTLKYWAVGMGDMLKKKNEAGLLKTPQYNATIVFNAMEDYQILQEGKQILEQLKNGQANMFNQDWLKQFEL